MFLDNKGVNTVSRTHFHLSKTQITVFNVLDKQQLQLQPGMKKTNI